jgi:hypothetical protein
MAAVLQYPRRETQLEDGDSGTSTLHDEEYEMINMKGTEARATVISIPDESINEQRTSPRPVQEVQAPQTVSTPAATPMVLPPPPKRPRANTRGSASPLRITTAIAGPGAPSPQQIGQIPSAQRTSTSSATLAQNASAGTGTHSPVMRSMFPRYEPGGPVTRQSYNPEVSSQKPKYSPSLYSQSGTPPLRTMSSFKPHRSNTHASPLHNSELPPPNMSSPEDLLDLWSIANGEGAENAAETYTLGLRW